MKFKHPAWIPVAWILSAVNVASIWFAAAQMEPLHATIHGALAALFAVGAQRLMARRALHPAGTADVANDRIRGVEQALDVMAVELERIGEGQRYVTKLMSERQRDAAPVARKPDEMPTPRTQPPREP